MKQGFIKLHRSILDWEWYDDPNTMRLFLHCLLKANHKDNNWRGILIKRGTFLTSLEKLSEQTKLSVSQIRTSLKKLKQTNEIASLSHARHRVITVVAYETYQGSDKLDSKIVASSSQASDKVVATNKNDKNVNNDKNEKKTNRAFSKPTHDEINKYAFDKKLNLEGFHDHYESNGWKVGKNPMKNWEAACRNWNKNQNSFRNQQKEPEFSDDDTGWAVDALNGTTKIMGLD